MTSPQGRKIYLNKIRQSVDFRKDWNFHYRLDQDEETQHDLAESMEEFSIVRGPNDELPYIQVRPNVHLNIDEDGRIEVLYNDAFVIGFLPASTRQQWIEILALLEELSRSPFIRKPLKVNTRAAISKVSNKWEAHISLRDPADIQERLTYNLNRLREEEKLRDSYSTEEWEDYLDFRYKYFELKTK